MNEGPTPMNEPMTDDERNSIREFLHYRRKAAKAGRPDDLDSETQPLNDIAEQLFAEVERLMEQKRNADCALSRIEWSGCFHEHQPHDVKVCPECGHEKGSGHFIGCWVAKALK